jgi:hypothetical protein
MFDSTLPATVACSVVRQDTALWASTDRPKENKMRTRWGRTRAMLVAVTLSSLLMLTNAAVVTADQHGGPWPRGVPIGLHRI